ncbi:MAG: hypothetical protein OIN66_07275 [Candidatus Methanoperedens sp.]|nr:hypothetical protein [Candidatus Methanoperedens sp.]
MADRCPKCGEVLVTKTIRKELGTGSIEIPVSEACPKCGFSRDMTGAADVKPPAMPVLDNVKKEEAKKEEVKRQVIEKPRIVSPTPKPQPRPESSGFNKYLTAGLAILVIAGLVWAFLIAPTLPKEPAPAVQPTPTPLVTSIPVATSAAASTPVAEVTQTGKSIPVFLDSQRGFIRNKDVTIKPGDEIVWRNTGINTLALVSSGGLFDAQLLAYDKEYRYIFKKTGTYGFYLKENPNLNGTIVVQP